MEGTVTIPGMLCNVASIRSRLRHSWLENQVLNRKAEVVASWRGTGSDAERAFAERLRDRGEFPARIEEARALVEAAANGFSPAQLISYGPLSGLSEQLRREIEVAVHCAYLEASGIEEAREPLRREIECVARGLRRLADLWEDRGAGETEVQNAFTRVQDAARALHSALGRLPEGIALP